MCLSIPAQVVSVNNDKAIVSVNGLQAEISIVLLEKVQAGEFVLVHSGFAIQTINREEAEKTLELVRLMRS
ncbi:MAG: HypC/HybG/HupF family hydrogenase formation chaperone [Bacteroidales bacterium]|nr:HypC/HybG/HupF family hydrogenase formation chaperone [Bacteroidales bacterium]